jgi:hypothetical protein
MRMFSLVRGVRLAEAVSLATPEADERPHYNSTATATALQQHCGATAPRPVPPGVLLSVAKQGSSELPSDGVLAHEVLAASRRTK